MIKYNSFDTKFKTYKCSEDIFLLSKALKKFVSSSSEAYRELLDTIFLRPDSYRTLRKITRSDENHKNKLIQKILNSQCFQTFVYQTVMLLKTLANLIFSFPLYDFKSSTLIFISFPYLSSAPSFASGFCLEHLASSSSFYPFGQTVSTIDLLVAHRFRNL